MTVFLSKQWGTPYSVDEILSKPVTLHGLREAVEKVMMVDGGEGWLSATEK